MDQALQPHDLAALSTQADIAITLVFAVLAIIALAFARRAIKAFEETTGIKVAESVKQQILDLVVTGLRYAEEQAHKKKRGLIADGPTTPEEKLDLARNVAQSLAPPALYNRVKEDFDIQAEALLQSMRPGGLGSPLLGEVIDAEAATTPSGRPLPRASLPPPAQSLAEPYFPRASKSPIELFNERPSTTEEPTTQPGTPRAKR